MEQQMCSSPPPTSGNDPTIAAAEAQIWTLAALTMLRYGLLEQAEKLLETAAWWTRRAM